MFKFKVAFAIIYSCLHRKQKNIIYMSNRHSKREDVFWGHTVYVSI